MIPAAAFGAQGLSVCFKQLFSCYFSVFNQTFFFLKKNLSKCAVDYAG